MSRRKSNMFPWSVGLCAMLVVLGLVGIVGVSYARYQVNKNAGIFYTPRQPEQVYLGQMVTGEDGETRFDPQAQGYWQTVENHSQLAFTVANGVSADDYAQQDQQVQIRLAGSLGVWNGEKTADVRLCIPRQAQTEESPIQFDEIQGIATRIQPDSQMYSVFGEGWVFTFPGADGKEMTFFLEGGSLSAHSMYIMIDGTQLTDPSLLQLIVTGYFVS